MGTVLKALIWKNLILRRNHWLQTLIEILVPLALVLLVNLFFPQIPKIPDHRESIVIDCVPTSIPDDALIYNPPSDFTESLMKRLGKRCGYKGSNVVPGDISNHSRFYEFGYQFGNASELNYTLYPYDGTLPSSLPIWYDESSLIGGRAGRRAVEKITVMQNSMEAEYVKQNLKESPPRIIGTSMDIFSRETNIYGTFIILAIFFSYSFLVSPVITRVVEEKESGAKELMRMMGVKSWQLWFSRLIDPLMVVCLVAIGIVILLYIPLTKTSTVVVSVNPLLFWFTYVMGMLSVIISLFFISCWFDSPIIAGSVAQLIGMSSVIILGFMQVSAIAWGKRLLYCLLPHMTLIYSAQTLLSFEYYGKDVNWSERLSVDGSSLNLREIFIMMIVDIILYGLLTWYLDNIRPGKFGVPRGWFFFTKCFSSKADVSPDSTPLKRNSSVKSGIVIHQLRKVYQSFGRAPVVAVDSVNLVAQEGRITALLGHNGAGKTTTMHIITGLIPATSGTVLINGHDIKLDPDNARSSLGLCPQQDLLFPDLTALQTLVFFGMIKGLSRAEAREEALSLLDVMKMCGSRGKETQNLSGGQKRKLSLGVAIIGGSKVLILDEPTAGVDPELRREICDLLLSFRGSRTILLTTHIMEEADAICDHINIMDHGLIKCFGTPMDLKSKFGTGYTLQVVVKENAERKVIDAVKAMVKDSRFKTQNASTLVFQLPSAQTTSFPELFRVLDAMQSENAIVSYGVSISTLEDVFIRVREIEDEKKKGDETDGASCCSTSNILNTSNYTGAMLVWRQFWALMVKKWLVFIRSYASFLFFSCMPLVYILISNVLIPQMGKISQDDNNGKLRSFNYTTTMYPGMEIMISVDEACAKCRNWEVDFKKLATDRGFLVANVLNVTKAAYDLFQHDFHQYSRHLAFGLEITSDTLTVQYNTHATHILPVAVNLINNALLHKNGIGISSSSNFSLVTNVMPDIYRDTGDTPSASLTDIIGFQPLFYMSAIHFEKLHGSKHLISMAAGSILYWASHFIFDFITFAVYAGVMSAIYYIIEPEDTIFTELDSYIGAVLLWGVGLILISYLITLFTRNRGNSITIAFMVYYVFSFVLLPFTQLNMIPKWVGYLHPSSIWKMYDTQKYDYLLVLAVYDVMLFAFIVFLDSKHLARIFHAIVCVVRPVKFTVIGEKDSNVAEVEKYVSEHFHDKMLPVAASSLRRSYGLLQPKPAVRGVSFHVNNGQCFGLIGVNGAGKTTTFNMLTAQIARSEGDARIRGSLLSSWFLSDYVSQFSFCPQSSGIIPLLEGQEYLELFARLRGFTSATVPDVVHNWIKTMDLEEAVGKRCGRYSGGTERKLVAAAAFLWDATVVMLDEPTAGVDPVARRCIWKAIAITQQNGNCVILTSHSMEECEALCSKVAIMVDGSFRCIGETTTLKKKFGDGYSVQLKISAESDDKRTEFEKAVGKSLGRGCRLTDRHCSILHYHVQDAKTNWATLFSKLEQLKTQFPIFESYIASETTLEEIFLAFAGHRRPPSGDVHCVDIV